jgi:hypothetical protein
MERTMEVLDNIPIKLDFEVVSKKLRLRNKNENVEKIIRELIETSRSLAKPKAVFEISRVENKCGDSVDIGGVRFTSHVLRVNLDKAERVYPYVVTCGRELDEIKIPPQEVMKCYFLDQIKELVVRSALNYLHDYLKKNHAC